MMPANCDCCHDGVPCPCCARHWESNEIVRRFTEAARALAVAYGSEILPKSTVVISLAGACVAACVSMIEVANEVAKIEAGHQSAKLGRVSS
jgi:hypothetical protein